MTSAYEYAESGGRVPPYLRLSFNVERYGALDVVGRTLTVREIYWMNAARRVYDSKRAVMQTDNRAEWAKANPANNDLLIYVEKVITDKQNE